MDSSRYLYIFLDEAGNFDFSPGGTKYFTLTGVAITRPFVLCSELTDLRYDLVEQGEGLEYFHASEDQQDVRNRVFQLIGRHLPEIRVDSIIVEKRKTGPALCADVRFYPEMLGYLLRYVLKGVDLTAFDEVLVFTDAIPVKKKQEAIKKGVKVALAKMLPPEARYRVLHHSAKAHAGLQIADYCSWAIYRKWDRADERSYRLVRDAIRSEFDIFAAGTTFYY